MKLNRTGSNWSEMERNKTNENWRIIEGNYNDVVDKVSEEAFEKVVDSAKLNWKEPVDSFADLPSAASEGDTRMARDTGKVYRFNGEVWQEIQQIDAGPVNELDERLTTQLADIAINVKMFGAVGDGATDDSEAILNAMETMVDGSTLVFPWTVNGYVLSESIDLNGLNNVTIKGLGGIVKIKHSDDSNIVTFKAKDQENITFENLYIDVNGTNQDFGKYPAYVNTSFYMVDIKGLNLKNIFVKDSVRDLKMLRCKNINCYNVHVDGARVDGWSLDNCDGGILINVSTINVHQDDDVAGILPGDVNGFEIEDGTKNISIYDIYTENCKIGAGIKIKSHDGISVCSDINIINYSAKNSQIGLSVTNNCFDISVDNYKADGISQYPIFFGGSGFSNIKINDFNIRGSGGVRLVANSENVVFDNGKIEVIADSGPGNFHAFSFSGDYIYDNYIINNVHSESDMQFVGFSNTDKEGFISNSLISNSFGYSRKRTSLFILNAVGLTVKNTTLKSGTSTSNNTIFYSGDELRFINVVFDAVESNYGMELRSTNNVLFDNCQFTAKSRGINVVSSGQHSKYLNVFGCKIELLDNNGSAIYLTSSDNHSVKNLKLYNSNLINCRPIYWTNTAEMEKISLIGNFGDNITPTNNWSGDPDELMLFANNPPIEVPNL